MTALEDQLDADLWKQVKAERDKLLTSSAPRRRIFAVVNQKGGAGKTTTAVTLGAIWASWGLRVRIIDGDPQKGSATYWLPPQWEEGAKVADLKDVYFDDKTLDEATAPTSVPNLYLVASDKKLGQVEYAQLADANLSMKSALQDSLEDFHITIFDCRPSLGVLTVSALTAAEELLIPLGASGMDVPGLVELNETLETILKRLNPELDVAAVVICHDSDTLLSREVRKQLDQDYPSAIRHKVPRSVRVEEAPFAHEPITTYAPTNPATIAYVELAALLLLRGTA
ncbi:MAG: ParA family protein [Pyrinomonadaceae bacterium]|nr:ParA family protein [Longispora sp. (in: high G+C Gram-positive bacteria)]MBA3571320.1 ParA family protein [Pyrinomonadaceae bacterium]